MLLHHSTTTTTTTATTTIITTNITTTTTITTSTTSSSPQTNPFFPSLRSRRKNSSYRFPHLSIHPSIYPFIYSRIARIEDREGDAQVHTRVTIVERRKDRKGKKREREKNNKAQTITCALFESLSSLLFLRSSLSETREGCARARMGMKREKKKKKRRERGNSSLHARGIYGVCGTRRNGRVNVDPAGPVFCPRLTRTLASCSPRSHPSSHALFHPGETIVHAGRASQARPVPSPPLSPAPFPSPSPCPTRKR